MSDIKNMLNECVWSRSQTNDAEIKRVLVAGANIFNPLLVIHNDLKRFM